MIGRLKTHDLIAKKIENPTHTHIYISMCCNYLISRNNVCGNKWRASPLDFGDPPPLDATSLHILWSLLWNDFPLIATKLIWIKELWIYNSYQELKRIHYDCKRVKSRKIRLISHTDTVKGVDVDVLKAEYKEQYNTIPDGIE